MHQRSASHAVLGIRQLRAVLRKYFLLKRRRPIATLLEVIFPCALFGSAAWLFSLRSSYGSGNCFYPSLPFFPLDALPLLGEPLGSQAKCEVTNKKGGISNDCAPPPVQYREDLLEKLDGAVVCSRQRMDDAVRKLLDESSLGEQFSSWLWGRLEEDPQDMRKWLNATLDDITELVNSSLGFVGNISTYQADYFNSSWPADVLSFGGELQSELRRVESWWRSGLATNASLPANLTNGSWVVRLHEDTWNHTAVGSFLVDVVRWVETNLGINVKDYVSGVFGWVTKGWLSFALKTLSKGQVRRAVNSLHFLILNATGILRNFTNICQSYDVEVPVQIAGKVDSFIWFLTHFLKQHSDTSRMLDHLADLAFSDFDHILDNIIGKVQLPLNASRPAASAVHDDEVKGPFANFTQRVVLRIKAQAPDILTMLDTFEEKVEELKPKVFDGLMHILTADTFKAMEAAQTGDIRKLVREYLPWVEKGWRSRCPFRRDWLRPGKMVEIFGWMQDLTIYKAFKRNFGLNVTDFVQEAHAWSQGLDLQAISSAAKTIRALVDAKLPSWREEAVSVVSNVHVNARRWWWWTPENSWDHANSMVLSPQLRSSRAIGSKWLVLETGGVPVYTAKRFDSKSGARKSHGDLVVGTDEEGWIKIDEEPGFIPRAFLHQRQRVGLPEALGAAMRGEYFDRRGPEALAQVGGCSEDTETMIFDSLSERHLLIAPFDGESRQLVKLLAVELSLSSLTWRSAEQGFLRDLAEWPPTRAAFAFGAHELMNFVIKPLPDPESLHNYAHENPDRVLIGVVFKTDHSGGDFPAGALDVGYELRAHAQLLPRPSTVARQRQYGNTGNSCKAAYPYYERGFSFLQELMGRAVARLQAQRQTGSVTGSAFHQDAVRNAEANEILAPMYNLDLRFEQTPHEASPVNPAVMAFQDLSPCFFVACLIPAMALHVKDGVLEKQEKLREVMRIMGLKAWVYWFGQPIFALLQMVVLMSLVLASYYQFIPSNDMSLTCFFFVLYGMCIIAFASFVSSFFWRARSAAAVGGVLHFGSFLFYGVFVAFERKTGIEFKLFLCLIPTCAGSIGLLTLARWERSLVGASWANFHLSPRYTFNGRHVPSLSLLQVCIMLLWDNIMFFVLAWYVDKVSPGTFGIPHPWYFPCLPSFWCSHRKNSRIKSAAEPEEMNPIKASDGGMEFRQDELSGLDVSVQVCGVSKIYSNGKRAVDRLSFDMHQSTIVGLLGPNGAGKSTTMAMITGLYAPTSGDVLVHGTSIRRDPDEVRRWLGICLQHCALYDTLTAREHLQFFSVMKGMPHRAARQEVESMLQSAQLATKQDTLAAHLSAGMRRCLSIGCALIGGSSVLVLDEPTAGIDAAARREIWKLLLVSKQKRTMLLSTHAMEEAEALCDQIAVIKDGKLASFGSSMALKQHVGSKYVLQVGRASGAKEEDVTKAIHASLPSATFQGSRDSLQLCYSLSVDDRKRFPALLSALYRDKAQPHAGITSFAIQDSTLEVVFPEALALWRKSFREPTSPRDSPDEASAWDMSKRSKNSRELRQSICTGMRLRLKQCGGICWMRLLVFRRSKKVFFLTFVLPTFLVVLHVLTVQFAGATAGSSEEPALKMHIDMFDRLLNPNGGKDKKLFIPCSVELQNASIGMRICNALHDAAGDNADVAMLRLHEENSTLGRYQVAHPEDFIDSSIGGVSATEAKEADATVTLWFGKRGYHTLPVLMNLWNNARFRLLGLKDTKVQIWSHPLPNTETIWSEEPDPNNEVLACSMLMISYVIVNVFCISAVIVSTVHDRATGSNHQQLVTGVSPSTYWFSNFIIDIVLLLFPMTLNILGGIVSGLDAFRGSNVPALALLFVCYCLAMTPLMYVGGYFFSNAATAHVCATSANIFWAVMTVTTMWLVYMYTWSVEGDFSSEEEVVNKSAKVMGNVFMVLVPSYCCGRAILDLIVNYYKTHYYDKFGICLTPGQCELSVFHLDVVGKYLLALLGNAVFWFSVVLLIEFCRHSNLKACPSRCRKLKCWSGQPDCGDGEELASFQQSAGLVFDDVHKEFLNGCRQKPCKAVSGVKASVAAGECFGIVGSNGAGKTTTLKLVTGKYRPSRGDIYVEGMSVCRQLAKVRRNVGFCPQYDALPEMLTAGETLSFYLALRGLPNSERQRLYREFLRKLGLEAFEHTQTQNLSGGNRRKLSTAIALLGWPAVVLLDEPTAGIDVHARRMLWSVVQEAKHQGCAVLLTSHSMEECEALCNHVSVMAAGTLSPPRSPAHLKCEQGERYILTIKARVDKAGNGEMLCQDATSAYAKVLAVIRDFVKTLLPSATSCEDIWGVLRFQFEPGKPSEAGGLSAHRPLADVFQAMEEALALGGALHGVAMDYSISQVSVEDVLLDALSRPQGQKQLNSSSNFDSDTTCAQPAMTQVQPAVIGAVQRGGPETTGGEPESITGSQLEATSTEQDFTLRPQATLERQAIFEKMEEIDVDGESTTLEGAEASPRGLCCSANVAGPIVGL